MMKKQISKKKLERLTIEGGDFRKAARREGCKMSIQELRKLLQDDVKSLSRQELLTNLQRDISDAELELIMDRDRLFCIYDASVQVSTRSSFESLPKYLEEAEEVSDAQYATEVYESMGIPSEGDMYDIVSGDNDGMLMTIT